MLVTLIPLEMATRWLGGMSRRDNFFYCIPFLYLLNYVSCLRITYITIN